VRTILERLDALVYTADVGENSTIARLKVCQDLENLGIHLDLEKSSVAINSATEFQVLAYV